MDFSDSQRVRGKDKHGFTRQRRGKALQVRGVTSLKVGGTDTWCVPWIVTGPRRCTGDIPHVSGGHSLRGRPASKRRRAEQ